MRWAKWISLAVLTLALAGLSWGLWTVRRSFPTVDGELTIAGLSDRVEVVRDDWGVAHIYASNPHDLFFAQGYTHAQERFWQMDFWRHIGSARLSEMFGGSQLETDKFLRSLGLEALAIEEFALMNRDSREILEWYSEGVNAYLSSHDGADVSLEYAFLPLQSPGYVIEPWTPLNTLTWAKMMSWDLSSNMRSEIARAVLSSRLPIDRVEQLYPPYPDDHPVIVPDGAAVADTGVEISLPSEAVAALATAGAHAEEVWELTGGGFEGIGSNNWVIGGSLTESGKPILANDPHLGIQMPSIWFANGLHCVGSDSSCPYQLVGFSFPGSPGVVIGHNENIAWGVTTQAADTQDLFIEKVNPDNPDQYEIDGRWVEFETRQEEIHVAGGETVEFEARSTRHGPVISGTFLEEDDLSGSAGVDLPDEYVVALSWQTLEPSTLVESIIGINRATNYDEFREAVALWDIAAQNIVYADVEGNIAYQATGEIPIRAKGDGRWPVPGWASEFEWRGLVPFEEMPRLLNPPSDFIATANQLVLPPGSEPLIGIDGAFGYRADRIESMLQSNGSHDVGFAQKMQIDTRDGGAANLVPFLLRVSPEGDEKVEEIQSWLSEWSESERPYQADAGSMQAAAYQATWRHVLKNTFHDELPEEYWPTGGSRWFEIIRRLLSFESDPWWDDVDTTKRETRDEILHSAMVDAHEELTELMGVDPERWTWGRLHIARFENQTLGQSGIGPIDWLFNRTAPERAGGGSSIVNAIGWDADKSYLVDWLPSMRMVVDLSDLERSTFIHTTGNSGHAFHPYYDNMIEAWVDGVHAPMYWTEGQVRQNASSVLTMVPA